MTGQTAEHYGTRIKRERESQGLSQEALAFKAGVSLRAIARIEAGHVQPRRATLRVLLDALGLDPSEFGFMNGEAA